MSALSSPTPFATAALYLDQSNVLVGEASDLGVSSLPAGLTFHCGDLSIPATLETVDGRQRAVWSVSAAETAALPRGARFWIGMPDGQQVVGGSLSVLSHGETSSDSGQSARIIIGPTGQSAYQAAVAGGYEGSEAEWLASLHGAEGDPGITSADATALSAGADPTASIVDGVLTLGIPAGAKGDTGAKGDAGPTSASFVFSGTVVPRVGSISWQAPFAAKVIGVSAHWVSVGDLAATVRVNKAGASLHAPGSTVSGYSDMTLDLPVAADQPLTVDVIAVEGTISDLVVHVWWVKV